MSKIKPLGEHVLIKRVEAESTTSGGIVLPESAKEKPREGEIIALGDGRDTKSGKRVPFQVKEGDRVIFSSYAGSEIKVDGETFMVMTEDDILAIVT